MPSSLPSEISSQPASQVQICIAYTLPTLLIAQHRHTISNMDVAQDLAEYAAKQCVSCLPRKKNCS